MFLPQLALEPNLVDWRRPPDGEELLRVVWNDSTPAAQAAGTEQREGGSQARAKKESTACRPADWLGWAKPRPHSTAIQSKGRRQGGVAGEGSGPDLGRCSASTLPQPSW